MDASVNDGPHMLLVIGLVQPTGVGEIKGWSETTPFDCYARKCAPSTRATGLVSCPVPGRKGSSKA